MDKLERQYFIISKWHLLEFIRENVKVTKEEIKEFFALTEIEFFTRIKRLKYSTEFVKQKGDYYFLSNKAEEFLRNLNLISFLDKRNPSLLKSKKIANKLNKRFLHYLP